MRKPIRELCPRVPVMGRSGDLAVGWSARQLRPYWPLCAIGPGESSTGHHDVLISAASHCRSSVTQLRPPGRQH